MIQKHFINPPRFYMLFIDIRVTLVINIMDSYNIMDNDLTAARNSSMFWHDMWVSCNKPETGWVYVIMKKNRNVCFALPALQTSWT